MSYSHRDRALLFLASLLAIIAVVVAANDKPEPVWRDEFSMSFSEVTRTPIIGDRATVGQYYYDFTKRFTRVDRANGQFDRYCGTVHFGRQTPCSHIVVGEYRYLYFPQLKDCCMCCTAAAGCGVLSPTWLSSNTTYEGRVKLDGVEYDKWNKRGLQNNFYLQTLPPASIAYIIDQQPNDKMTFNVTSYVQTVPSVARELPSICNPTKRCPKLSVCTLPKQDNNGEVQHHSDLLRL